MRLSFLRTRLRALRLGLAHMGLACMGLACAGSPSWAHAACEVQSKATVPLTIVNGSVVVPLEVNGIAASFILDTGAQRSVVTEAAIRRLNLARDEWVGTTLSGIGGVNSRANADPRSMTLGGVPLVRHTLSHDTSLTVGMLPQAGQAEAAVDGLLGRDYLSVFDLDVDLPDRRLTVYQVEGCVGRFLPWSGGYAAIPVTMPMETAVVLPVVLDGVALRAMLDTGASSSLLAAPGMYRLGMDAARTASGPTNQVGGVGTHVVTMFRHQFRSLRVGGVTEDAPQVWVAPVHLTPIVDMLLGADWLAQRRIWLSYATRQIFVALP